jgi:hypothetical protein
MKELQAAGPPGLSLITAHSDWMPRNRPWNGDFLRVIDFEETGSPPAGRETVGGTELLSAATGFAVFEVDEELSDHHLLRLTFHGHRLRDVLVHALSA